LAEQPMKHQEKAQKTSSGRLQPLLSPPPTAKLIPNTCPYGQLI